MSSRSEIIYDIVEVERFRKILTFGYAIPPAAGIIWFGIFNILAYTENSNQFVYVLFFIINFPPALLTPYILYVLIKEKRFGWLSTYIILVILPAVITLPIIGIGNEVVIVMLVIMAPFYFFCFLIKFSVEEWIREYNWAQQLAEQRKEKEEKLKESLL